jgi:hypothetical protein
MKPSLLILKKQKGLTTMNRKTVVRIVVVDQEKEKKYPANFVCVLPSQLGFPDCTFEKLFGNKSSEMAKRLLLETLEKTTDSEVKMEIRRRLSILELT